MTTRADSLVALARPVQAHYEARLRLHGPTARGMDWKDEASQRLRFALLCDVCPLAGRSLHEVGAGVGHLYDFLTAEGIDADYSGSDVSPEMVAAARTRHPSVSFECRSVLDECGTAGPWDVVVGSGLFHVKADAADDAWRGLIQLGLQRMWDACRVAMAVNFMSNQVDYHEPGLYYSDPGEIFEYCRRTLSRHVVLRHDYPLYEYTLYVYRDAVSP